MSEMRSGDLLKDIDIYIKIRSGGTDFSDLTKLSQAVVASVRSVVDTKVVTTESEVNVLTKSGKMIITSSYQLRIE